MNFELLKEFEYLDLLYDSGIFGCVCSYMFEREGLFGGDGYYKERGEFVTI